MKTIKRSIAAVEVLLIAPAVLFMTALFVRELQPVQYEPARAAGAIVAWFAARPRVGLWLLLIALPLVVLVSGAATLLRRWQGEPELRQAARLAWASVRAQAATLFVAAATAASAAILAIVALHLVTD